MSQELWKPILQGTTAIEKLQADKGFDSYSALHNWSVRNPGEFWSRAWDDNKLIGKKGSTFFHQGTDHVVSFD